MFLPSRSKAQRKDTFWLGVQSEFRNRCNRIGRETLCRSDFTPSVSRLSSVA
jgi:hypothetical protein